MNPEYLAQHEHNLGVFSAQIKSLEAALAQLVDELSTTEFETVQHAVIEVRIAQISERIGLEYKHRAFVEAFHKLGLRRLAERKASVVPHMQEA